MNPTPHPAAAFAARHTRSSRTTTFGRRRVAVGITTLAVAGLALSGCSLAADTGGDGDAKTLTVATWKGYGADQQWTVDAFEKKTGATVEFVYIDSLQNMLSILKESDGRVDVALPNVQYIDQAIDSDLLLPLDQTKLANWDQICAQFADLPEIRVDDNLYGVPWVWGSSAMFYDSNAFGQAPTSLDALWDPANRGKVALNNDPTVLIPLTAMHLGLDPQNPELAAVEPALRELKDNARVIYSNSDDLAKAISNGSVTIGVGASSTVGSLIASGNDSLKYLIPTQGGIGWIDSWAITAASDDPDLAYEWLNYMTSTDFLVKWGDDPAASSPSPANEAAVADLSPEAIERTQSDPTRIGDLSIQLPQPADTLQAWATLWQRVAAG